LRELLGAVERLVCFLEHLSHRSGAPGVEHGEAGAEGEHTGGVLGVSLAFELARDSLQHVVAGLVAAGVVAGFEVIDVEQSNAVALTVPENACLE
jgi:hypothetical protein